MNLAAILENPDGPGLPEWPAFRENDQKVMGSMRDPAPCLCLTRTGWRHSMLISHG
jgi:hypothetical protein